MPRAVDYRRRTDFKARGSVAFMHAPSDMAIDPLLLISLVQQGASTKGLMAIHDEAWQLRRPRASSTIRGGQQCSSSAEERQSTALPSSQGRSCISARAATSALLFLLVTFVSIACPLPWSLPTLAQAQRPPSLLRREYPHLSPSSLASIPKLGDPAPILDHHDKESWLSRFLIPRVPGTSGIVTARNMLLDVFQKQLGPNSKGGRTGWHVEEHKSRDQTPHGEKDFVNLVFTKDPLAPRKLILSAHYDSKWFATGNFVGATDSAAPCAMLVDLALAIDGLLEKAVARKDETTLQIVFFDGEEAFDMWTHTDSTYGSRALAANWSTTFTSPGDAAAAAAGNPRNDHEARRLTTHSPIRKIDSIDHLVLLDLLGAKGYSIPSYYASTHWLFEELQSVEKRLFDAKALFPTSSTSAFSPDYESFFRSGFGGGGIEDDHLPFLANGVPILHLIPSPFPHVWHTIKDDASALDWDTDYAWAMILRLFTIEYLRLEPNSAQKQRAAGGDDDGVRSPSQNANEAGQQSPSWLRDSHELASNT
ncbi:unnamed protein product [Jaminaea pallidilutea]